MCPFGVYVPEPDCGCQAGDFKKRCLYSVFAQARALKRASTAMLTILSLRSIKLLRPDERTLAAEKQAMEFDGTQREVSNTGTRFLQLPCELRLATYDILLPQDPDDAWSKYLLEV